MLRQYAEAHLRRSKVEKIRLVVVPGGGYLGGPRGWGSGG